MPNKHASFLLAAAPAIVGTILAPTSHAQTAADDRQALTHGVTAIYAPGALVGTMTIFDDTRAFTVVAGREDRGRAPIVAAARAGVDGSLPTRTTASSKRALSANRVRRH